MMCNEQASRGSARWPIFGLEPMLVVNPSHPPAPFQAFSLAVEKLMNIEVPQRAQYIRGKGRQTPMAGLERACMHAWLLESARGQPL